MAKVIFSGESFRIADRIGLMPLMRFAKVAQSGVDADDMAGLAAMYDLLEQCLADDEWARFQAHADKVRADGDELMALVAEVFEVLSQRPTSRPSDSSDGPPTTSENSADDSSSPVVSRLVTQGRRDLAQIVEQAEMSRSA